MHLRKLLQIFYAPSIQRRSLLRADIRQELAKNDGKSGDGGDFHTAFWSGAKRHAIGTVDLRAQIEEYIQRSPQRKRLYPLLGEGFLVWWDEKRRWRNEPFVAMPRSLHGRFVHSDSGAIIKVENLLSLRIGDRSNRLIYPYFAEEPPLSGEAVRIGLWLMSHALPDQRIEDMRVLDVLRSASYGTLDVPLQGDEEEVFLRHYQSALAEWIKLRAEYE